MMTTSRAPMTVRMLSDFCKKRISHVLPPRETERLRIYLVDLLTSGHYPPMRGTDLNWELIAVATELDPELLLAVRDVVRPGIEALQRALKLKQVPRSQKRIIERGPHGKRLRSDPSLPFVEERSVRPRGVPPRPVVEFPDPKWTDWIDPAGLAAAMSLQMQRHGDTSWSLYRAIIRPGENFDQATLRTWRIGKKAPRSVESFEMLARIERRYRLPAGYFKRKLPHPGRATSGFKPADISAAERRRLAWHLPDDFDERPTEEQEQILAWVRSVVISGSTEYRRFQAAAMRQRYAVQFRSPERVRRNGRPRDLEVDADPELEGIDPELMGGVVDAPFALEAEMVMLVGFKTSTLTASGHQRNGVWNEETASQKIEHLGLMFGRLPHHHAQWCADLVFL